MATKAGNNSPEKIAERRKKLGLSEEKVTISSDQDKFNEEQLKKLKDLNTKRKAAATKRTQQAKIAGDTSFTSIPFVGFTVFSHTKVNGYRIRTCKIPTFVEKEGEVQSDGGGRVGHKVKIDLRPIQIAYGYKTVKRKKDRKKKGGSSSLIRKVAWFTVSVPEEAKFVDIIAWVKTWGKVPAIVRVGQREQLLGKMAESAGAMI